MGEQLAREFQDDLAIRIAAHTGEVFQTEDDVHGQTVNLAARLLTITGKGETSLSAEAWAELSGQERAGLVAHGPEVFKGFTRHVCVYKRLNPRPQSIGTVRPEAVEETEVPFGGDLMTRHETYELVLDHPDINHRSIHLREGETHVIGRSRLCDTRMSDRAFSDLHAALAVVEGILWVFDLGSSNGTYCGARRIERRRIIGAGTTVTFPQGAVRVSLP